LRERQMDAIAHAHEHGVDVPELDSWTWPY
jgi:hypothetical protein